MNFVSKSELDDAVAAVAEELQALGIWSPVRRAEVYWCRWPQYPLTALGFFIHWTHPWVGLLGYHPGHIYIPSITLGTRDIADVLRHEYGHALAHYRPTLLQHSPGFKTAFGGSYIDDTPRPHLQRSQCVSAYAMTSPMEDFAETFARFVRDHGEVRSFRNPRLRRKFEFVAHACALIKGRAAGRAPKVAARGSH